MSRVTAPEAKASVLLNCGSRIIPQNNLVQISSLYWEQQD